MTDSFAEAETLAEAQPRTLLGFLGLRCAVARRRVGMQRSQQPMRGSGDFLDRTLEGSLIGLRRLVEAGQLAHELQGGGVDFVIGCRRLEVKQRLDVSAHFDLLKTREPHGPSKFLFCDRFCTSVPIPKFVAFAEPRFELRNRKDTSK